MPDKTEKQLASKISILVVYSMVMIILVPFLALYAGKGAESIEYVQKTWTYYAVGIGSLMGVIALVVAKNYGSKFGYGFIFSPEDGWLNGVEGMKWLKSPLKVVFLAVLLASLTGLTGVLLNTSFVGIPNIEQQVTETANLALAVEPASTSEVLLELFVLFGALSFVFFFAKKYKWGKSFIIPASLFIAIPIRCIFAVGIHLLRYGSQEANLIGIFILRYMNSLITLTTGNIIYEFAWHSLNNFFFKLNTMFSNEVVLITTGIVLGVISVVGIALWIKSNGAKS